MCRWELDSIVSLIAMRLRRNLKAGESSRSHMKGRVEHHQTTPKPPHDMDCISGLRTNRGRFRKPEQFPGLASSYKYVEMTGQPI